MLKRMKEYFVNSSIHGFHYILESDRHWTERIFWMIVCGLSGYGTWIFLNDAIYAFKHNAISFVVETDYLHWNTTFPALSICEQESPDKLSDIAQELYGDSRDMNIDFYLRDIAFFDGACYSCSAHCASGELNCTQDFDFIIGKVREKCRGLIDNCTWNGKSFPCCDNFLPLQTEGGLCFTINSIHTKKKANTLPKLVSNRQTGLGVLQLQVSESVKAYVHSSEDVPSENHPQEEEVMLNWGSIHTMSVQITEITNDPNVPLVDIEQRNCRLPEETDLDVYDYYAYSACVVNCRARVQMALCNCTSHYIPWRNKKGKKTCGIEGLTCLTLYAETLRAVRRDELMALNITECECMPGCNEPEFYIVESDTDLPNSDRLSDSYDTKIIVKLDALPTKRYARKVVRTRMDLLVSVGGTFGLFLGASILSLIELCYYVFMWICSSGRRKDIRVDKESTKNKHDRTDVIRFRTRNINVISPLTLNSRHLIRRFPTQRKNNPISVQWTSKSMKEIERSIAKKGIYIK